MVERPTPQRVNLTQPIPSIFPRPNESFESWSERIDDMLQEWRKEVND